MTVTYFCSIFGDQNGCTLLFYLKNKYNFENLGGDKLPGCPHSGCGPASTYGEDTFITTDVFNVNYFIFERPSAYVSSKVDFSRCNTICSNNKDNCSA